MMAKPFIFLFERKSFYFLFITGTIISLFGIIFLFQEGIVTYNINSLLQNLNISLIICIYLILQCKSIIHELGHISALNYYMREADELGLGVYLTFFVFYVSIDEIWYLKRKERIIINLGGIYFTLLTNIIVVVVVLFTNLSFIGLLFRYILIFNFLNILTNLFPFLRYDGYWILSDWLDIPNLQKRFLQEFKNIFKKKKNYFNNISLVKRKLLILYFVLYTFVFAYAIYIVVKFTIEYVILFHVRVDNFQSLLFSGKIQLIMGLMIIFGIFFWIIRIIKGKVK